MTSTSRLQYLHAMTKLGDQHNYEERTPRLTAMFRVSCLRPFVKSNNYNINLIAIKCWFLLIFNVAISIVW